MRTKSHPCGPLVLFACMAALLAGCHDSSSGGKKKAAPEFTHQDVALKDELGHPITIGSTEAYSPRETCGACHWVDYIANGYHFSQGRTGAMGNIVAQANYFGDGRSYVRSAGMYGKW